MEETGNEQVDCLLTQFKDTDMFNLIPAHPGSDHVTQRQGERHTPDHYYEWVAEAEELCSRQRSASRPREQTCDRRPPDWEAEQRAEELIKQAEASKARIYEIPGKSGGIVSPEEYARSMLVDTEYPVVGAHLDDNIKAKIERGEYVDFAKLLP